MKILINAVLLGFAIAMISLPALAREEQWQVSVQGWTSTFMLNISNNGKVSGMSHWGDNASGRQNKLTGKIDGSSITLIRHLAGLNTGNIQTFSGDYYEKGTIAEGEMTGLGGPGTWTATVKVIEP